jgi:hypothetical protein
MNPLGLHWRLPVFSLSNLVMSTSILFNTSKFDLHKLFEDNFNKKALPVWTVCSHERLPASMVPQSPIIRFSFLAWSLQLSAFTSVLTVK